MIAYHSSIPDKCWKHPLLWRSYSAAAILFLPILLIVGCFLEGYRNIFDGHVCESIKEIFLIAFGRWETREQELKRKGWIN